VTSTLPLTDKKDQTQSPPENIFRLLDNGLRTILIIYLTGLVAKSVLGSAFGIHCRQVVIRVNLRFLHSDVVAIADWL
jgi:hypothetical protein